MVKNPKTNDNIFGSRFLARGFRIQNPQHIWPMRAEKKGGLHVENGQP